MVFPGTSLCSLLAGFPAISGFLWNRRVSAAHFSENVAFVELPGLPFERNSLGYGKAILY